MLSQRQPGGKFTNYKHTQEMDTLVGMSVLQLVSDPTDCMDQSDDGTDEKGWQVKMAYFPGPKSSKHYRLSPYCQHCLQKHIVQRFHSWSALPAEPVAAYCKHFLF